MWEEAMRKLLSERTSGWGTITWITYSSSGQLALRIWPRLQEMCAHVKSTLPTASKSLFFFLPYFEVEPNFLPIQLDLNSLRANGYLHWLCFADACYQKALDSTVLYCGKLEG